MNTGITYYKKGDYNNALNIFNNALQTDGKNANLTYLRAISLGNKRDYANALQGIAQAKALGQPIDENIVTLWQSKLPR